MMPHFMMDTFTGIAGSGRWFPPMLADGDLVVPPALQGAHIFSDFLIGVSYVAISLTLLSLVAKAGKSIPFHWILVAFGGFIVSCGWTHFMHVAVVADASNVGWLIVSQIVTVIASVATAIVLPSRVPQVLALIQAAAQSDAHREQLEAAKQLAEDASRAKSEFLANMSHELRTPLTAILGFNELLRDNYLADPGERRAAFDDVERSGLHLLSLINDVLDLSKIEAGQMDLDLATVDLGGLLEETTALLRERAVARGVSLTVDTAALPPIAADSRKVKQIVFNLLANAVKFTPAGGAVTLTTQREGECVAITVCDTGIGISAADQARLFQPFSQVDSSLARRHDGTGLGLALTKQLAELHGGTIAVQSAPGEGSTFTVRLPIAPVPVAAPMYEYA